MKPSAATFALILIVVVATPASAGVVFQSAGYPSSFDIAVYSDNAGEPGSALKTIPAIAPTRPLTLRIEGTPGPEPASLALLAIGTLGLARRRRVRRA